MERRESVDLCKAELKELDDCLEEVCRKGESRMRSRASLVAQWLRILLPVQGTRVRALVQEDPTCRRAAGPVRHNY